MPNVFKPVHNSRCRISLIMAPIAVILVFVIGSGITRFGTNTNVGNALDQPVPFSHLHHATELGIDCRYCHTSVEKGPKAGIPSTETCMSCHSQIWTNAPALEPVRQSYAKNEPIKWAHGDVGWTRLNKLPEFVFFNHSIHIDRGVSCNNCHGPIQQMPMTYKGNSFQMSWCLDCHRHPEQFLYTDPENAKLPADQKRSPRQQVFALYQKYQRDPKTGSVTERERSVLLGNGQGAHGAEDLEDGKKVVEKFFGKDGVDKRKRQLEDCSICHH